jgi:mono/diheme cytochrome c family protein
MKRCLGFILVVVVLVAADKKKTTETKEWKVPARAAQRENPVQADENSIAVGKTLYVKECLDCHGPKGHGDGAGARDLDAPVPDLSDAKMWKQSDGSMFYKITEGRDPMPAAENLSDEQRWHIVNYVRTLAPRPRDSEEKQQDAQTAKGK